MEVVKDVKDDVLTFKIIGRMDSVTSGAVEKAVEEANGEANKLVLDLSALEYVSSAGLRVLLAAHKAYASKGGMVITGANEEVMEVFDMTGFVDIFDIQ